LQSIFFTALSKELLCRVPDRMHLANILALSEHPVSGSVYTWLVQLKQIGF